MEFIIGFICVVIVLSLLVEAIKAIDWIRFLRFFILGSIALAALFSYTAEGVFVIIVAYAVLLFISVFYGAFKNLKKDD